MTLTEILADSYRRLGYSTSPASEVTTRLTAFANETHRELLALPGLEGLRDDQITVASVASTARIALPPSVGRIQSVQNRTNQILLKETTLAEIRRRNPGLTITGIPTEFARAGFQEVATQPAAATGVWAASSSAADTVPTVTVAAIRTGGYLHAPAATALTGTSRVQIGTQTDYIDITRFYLSAACVGDVTLYDAAASGNTLAVIPKGQTFARYQVLQLDPVPSSALTYYIDYTRNVPEMANGTDEPLLPLDFHRLIGLGIRKKEWEAKDDDRYTSVAMEFEHGARALRHWVQTDGTQLLSLRRSSAARPSQLGSWYPAGS